MTEFTKEDCAKVMLEAASELGADMTAEEYRDAGFSPSAMTVANRFGGWNAAKEELNLRANVKGGRKDRALYFIDSEGYETWRDKYQYKESRVKVHRLVAVAEYGINEVKDRVVHHRNEVPWDNRPGNLQLMTPEDHATHHHGGEV